MSSKLLLVVLAVLVVLGAAGWFIASRPNGGAAASRAAGVAPLSTAGAAAPAAELRPGESSESSAAEAERAALPRDTSARPAPLASSGSNAISVALEGRLVDAQGQGVAGADVDYTESRFGFFEGRPSKGAHQATSDANGHFKISGLSPGTGRLRAHASGFALLRRDDIVLPAEPRYELGALTLEGAATLAGWVLDPAGRGVANAKLFNAPEGMEIFLSPEFGRDAEPLAIADADGSFTLDTLPVGPWRVLVRSDDHPDRVFEGATQRVGEQQKGLRFELEAGSAIEGVAYGIPEGETETYAIARKVEEDGGRGFSIGRRTREASIDAQGRFSIRGLDLDSNWQVQLRSRARRPGQTVFFGSQPRSAAVKAKSGERGLKLEWQPESAIVAQFVDAKTGRPIEVLRVSAGTRWPQPLLGPEGKPLTQHPEGRVRAGEMYPGGDSETATLIAEAAGYERFERSDIQLARGTDTDLGVLRLQPMPVLVVEVVDQSTGAPIENANVTLSVEEPDDGPGPGRGGMRSRALRFDMEDDAMGDFGPQPEGSRRARTDAQGRAALTSFPGQACTLKVRSKEHAPALIEHFTPGSEASSEKRVELSRGGSALVRVVDAKGKAVSGARVDHRRPSSAAPAMPFFAGPGAAEVTNSKGELLLEHLEPGKHSFKVGEDAPGRGGMRFGAVRAFSSSAEPEEEGWTEASIAEGQQSDVRLTSAPRGSLIGQVREGGLPLPGARLRLEEDRGERGGARAFTAVAGGFSLGLDDGGGGNRTDGEGRYHLDPVKIGKYKLIIEHSARAMPASLPVEIREGEQSFDVDLLTTSIAGRVVDPKGQPLAGVRVRAERRQSGGQMRMMMVLADNEGGEAVRVGGPEAADSSTTDADGHYLLRGVEAEVEVIVKAESKEHQPVESAPLRLAPGENKLGVDLTLEAAGKLSIEALKPDGSAASMLMLRAEPVGVEGASPEVQFVGPTGRATISSLKPGTYKVVLQKMGGFGPGEENAAAPAQTAEVKAGETAKLSFTVEG